MEGLPHQPIHILLVLQLFKAVAAEPLAVVGVLLWETVGVMEALWEVLAGVNSVAAVALEDMLALAVQAHLHLVLPDLVDQTAQVAVVVAGLTPLTVGAAE